MSRVRCSIFPAAVTDLEVSSRDVHV